MKHSLWNIDQQDDTEDEEDNEAHVKGGTSKAVLNHFIEDVNNAIHVSRGANLPHCTLTIVTGEGRWQQKVTKHYHYEHAEMVLMILRELIFYKKNYKLYTSYVKKSPSLYTKSDQCFHPSFLLTTVATGRTSCKNPPMQTFPYKSRAKDIFVSRFSDGLISAVDYSQQELRVAAMLSKDPAMTQAFVEGKDIHRTITSEVMKIPFHEVPDHLRRHFKTVVFGILYGRGAKAIAADLGIPEHEAKSYISKFFESRKNLREYIQRTQMSMKATNYVTTPMGRRIMIYEPGNYVEHAVNRWCINYPIQGMASDFGLAAGARIQREIYQRGLKTKIFNFVHDSLMFDHPMNETEIIWQLCQLHMVEYPKLHYDFMNGVPLAAEAETGLVWGHQVEFTFEADGLHLQGGFNYLGEIHPHLTKHGWNLKGIQDLGLKEGEQKVHYHYERPPGMLSIPGYYESAPQELFHA
jgi:hypothetical protein